MSTDSSRNTETGALGAFPVPSPDDIFGDDDFHGSFHSNALDIVTESSVEGGDGNSISVSSSEEGKITDIISNTQQAALIRRLHEQQQQQQRPPQHISATSRSGGPYPYSMYQSTESTYSARQDNEGERGVTKILRPIPKKLKSAPQAPSKKDTIRKDDEQPSSPASDDASSVDRSQLSISQVDIKSVMTPRGSSSRAKRYTVRSAAPAPPTQHYADPSSMLESLFIGLEQERHMHKLAAQNLRAVNNWLLFLPSFLLTLVAGIVSLVSESTLNISEKARVYYSIGVGVVALVAVFWQAVAKQLDLASRASLHDTTSIALKRLSEDVLLTMSSTSRVSAEYVNLISEKFGQALDGCSSASVLPIRIESAFAAISDRMVLMLRPPTGQPPRKTFVKLALMRLYSMVYDELTTEIIHHWLWPFSLPLPRRASDAALRNFKEIITEGREASRGRGKYCCCFGGAEERSLFDVLPPETIVNDPQEFVRNRNGAEV
eukprot:CAMPEP_0119567052 /NCGR_PEP_ID=MMETSP1352-20130426/34825_1 /TAXON_ID=265584 /ORGANISM="Stauroneis constricta, Strain CCMP1120" /LENGTH=490 /DNA_ID=CAMNT_0007616249 /DNA_START=34 /DNA_END=1506 /DNA_ORIENTATION=-